MRMGNLRFHRRGKGVIRNNFGCRPRKKKNTLKANDAVLKKDIHNELSSLLASANSYLQTFITAFSSAIMAIDIALLVMLLTNSKKILERKDYEFCINIFIPSLGLYFISICLMVSCRRFAILAIQNDLQKTKESRLKFEKKLTTVYVFMFVICIYFIVLLIYLMYKIYCIVI